MNYQFGIFQVAAAIQFIPSRQKVDRAKQKLKFIQDLLVEWSSGGVKWAVNGYLYNHRLYVCATVDGEIPQEIPWEVVEAVGHLRSALDKMIVEIVENNGFGASGIGFPFGGLTEEGKPKEFPDRWHNKIKNKLTSEQWLILLRQNPYPGGNDLLWSINTVANQDKHKRELIAVRPIFSPSDWKITGGISKMGPLDDKSLSGMEFGPHPNYKCPGGDKESLLFSMAFGPGSTLPDIQPAMSASVNFGDIKPVSGHSILNVLSGQIQLVSNIVDEFEAVASRV